MRFYSEEKELSVFNRRKKIANFENGVFETENENVIEKLKPHFRYENPKVLSNMANFLKLKQEAKEKGINTFKMKKKDLIKALEEYDAGKI
ncbi:MAG: hypothetical protein IMZ64_12790 [Bacteroidetes bacterium]|nr:hypothetical protein [Bacteroidota bacterium]